MKARQFGHMRRLSILFEGGLLFLVFLREVIGIRFWAEGEPDGESRAKEQLEDFDAGIDAVEGPEGGVEGVFWRQVGNPASEVGDLRREVEMLNGDKDQHGGGRAQHEL